MVRPSVVLFASEVFATAIATDATDYRYAHRQNRSGVLRPVNLGDDLAERCVRLAAGLRLPVAGIT